jgi:hypothetical protein
LGWIIDTVSLTIELPAHQIARLFELLDSVPPHQRRVSTKQWQQLVGELRSMVLAVPGGRGLFSVLQQVIKVRTEDGTRARLSMEVHAILQDFRSLAKDLQKRQQPLALKMPQGQEWEVCISYLCQMVPSHHRTTSVAITFSARRAIPSSVVCQSRWYHHQ